MGIKSNINNFFHVLSRSINRLNNSHPIKVQFFPDIDLIHPGIILEIAGKRILVDPGPDTPGRKSYYSISRYDLPNLDAILISHYHGDHSSLITKILNTSQFKGPIICHVATAEIMQAYYDNLRQSSEQFIKLDYGRSYHLFNSISITIFNAGHVLGSSIISVNYQNKNIIITGDLGAEYLPMVRKPETIFPPVPIDLLILDAKQAGKKKIIDSTEFPVGKIIYHKIKDCFLFDEGNILIYAPMVQIPVLLYCLNYIFESKKFQDIHHKVTSIYLDPQPKLLELLDIFTKFSFLFDRDESEYLYLDLNRFDFDKLKKILPPERDIHNSIVITPNRNVFVRYFESFKRSEENDVLLLNDNIHYALKDSSQRIDKHCHIQIKRIPFLHYHPDLVELTNFCNNIKNECAVNRIVLYHYKNPDVAEDAKKILHEKTGVNVEAVHRLSNNSLII